MKKIFIYPIVEVKSLSSENEVMGVFNTSAEASMNATVIVDNDSAADDDIFTYW